MAKAKAKSKKKKSGYDPAFIQKEKQALKRRHRKTILFNDRELALIDEYCQKNKISYKSGMMRRIIMEKLLTDMGQKPPTLF